MKSGAVRPPHADALDTDSDSMRLWLLGLRRGQF